MYIGFELRKFNKNFFDYFDYYLNIGNEIFIKHKRIIQKTLNQFEKNDGSLNGDKMQSNWFPKINTDVFLCHSHSDKDLVIAFAGWLKDNFDLEVFVDSCIWGYYKDLQKLIDNRYSKNPQRGLDYDNVLFAASHVNMMLNTALMQMIDNCECLIFINTPNSVKPNEVVNKIISPWIYSELAMTKLITKKSLQSHRVDYINESKVFSELQIEYNLDTKHLCDLSTGDLSRWEGIGLKKYNALDYLYKMKS